MTNEIIPKDVLLQWEGSHEIFDGFPLLENENEHGFAMRTMLSTRGSSLKDIVLGFCGYMTIVDSNTIKQAPYGQLLLALCAIILINPFEIKVLKGCGIDPLITSSDFDNETGERYLLKKEFKKACNDNGIDCALISWLEEKKLIRQDNEKIFFSRTLKKGKIIQKV